MNNIAGLENIGGNLVTNQFYRFKDDKMVDLDENDYNMVIIDKNNIKLCFPLGINGIVSPHINYQVETNFNLKTLIKIIDDYYNGEFNYEENELLNKSGIDSFNYSSRRDLLDESNLCYFEGVEYNSNVYTLLLGS